MSVDISPDDISPPYEWRPATRLAANSSLTLRLHQRGKYIQVSPRVKNCGLTGGYLCKENIGPRSNKYVIGEERNCLVA